MKPPRFRTIVPRTLWLVAASSLLAGCASPPATPSVSLIGSQTVPGIGAGQGIAARDGFIYLYGDAETGVIREYRLIREPAPQLDWTGREIRLTRDGENTIPHPTGLAFHPGLPTFIGNTVKRQGTLFRVDWQRMLQGGNLDNAVLGVIEDDRAVNGTRPENVRRAGRWLIATSDYGQERNELRYYDPHRLTRAKKTSEAGVLVAHQACGPWVQGLCWLGDCGVLVIIQNQQEGRGWRLTCLPSIQSLVPESSERRQDLEERGELEGFCAVGRDLCILLRSGRRENVFFGNLVWESAGH